MGLGIFRAVQKKWMHCDSAKETIRIILFSGTNTMKDLDFLLHLESKALKKH
jgi:hypothetical protein